jgi:hypothetical protein
MAKSKVTQLDPRVRAAVDDAVRDGRATIDEIVLLVKQLGGAASRSSVGRYVKNATAQLKKFREAQEIAKVWIGKLNADPEGDVGRLLAEMLKTVAFQQIADMGEGEAETTSMDLMLVAKALDHLSRSQKVDVDRWVKVRDTVGTKLKALEEKAGGTGGKITVEDLQAIRQVVYGLAK